MASHPLDARSKQLLVASHEAKQLAGARGVVKHWERALADAEQKLAEAKVGATDEKPERLAASVRLFKSRIEDAQERVAEAQKAYDEVCADVCERCGLGREKAATVRVVRDADGIPESIEA